MSDRGRNENDSKRSSSGSRGGQIPISGSPGQKNVKYERHEHHSKMQMSNERHHQRSLDQFNASSMGGSPNIMSGRGGMFPMQGMMPRGSVNMMNVLSGQAFSDNELMTDLPKKKFTGRCRLFVGNLPNDLKEEELKELFTPHGDIAECYLSGKGFAFLRMDTRAHAESAKEAIDGKIIHNRPVRVRFAVHGAALRVKELSTTVSNEMLYHAFSAFGEVERAVHIVDEKGKPTGEGIVEFERKPSANEALHQIRDKVFLLTASPKPLVVEMLEPRDEDDGLAERMIQRNALLQKEREVGPRFPPTNSFEYVFGLKWKELYEMERQRRSQLDEELKEARRRLEADMDLAFQDYQTQLLREDLARRQQELERLEAAKRERMAQVAARRGGDMSLLNNLSAGQLGSQGSLNGMQSGQDGRGQEMMGRGPLDMQRGPLDMQRGPLDMQRGPLDMQRGQMDMQRGQIDMQRNAPPFQQGPPGSGGIRLGGPGGGKDPSLVQGVQKLLQIFRADGQPGGRVVGPHNGPNFGGGPGHMGPGGFSGAPPGFNRPGSHMQGDFSPAEKRMRR